jgi:hypothetical protein
MRDFFRRWILRDLDIKVLALLISIGLWWMVGRDPVVETIVTAPVDFRHAPPNLVLTSDSQLEVQVAVTGPERIIRALKPADVSAILDLSVLGPASTLLT